MPLEIVPKIFYYTEDGTRMCMAHAARLAVAVPTAVIYEVIVSEEEYQQLTNENGATLCDFCSGRRVIAAVVCQP